MKNAANLIFLDQFGIKYVDKEMFLDLIALKTTDIIFFVFPYGINIFINETKFAIYYTFKFLNASAYDFILLYTFISSRNYTSIVQK